MNRAQFFKSLAAAAVLAVLTSCAKEKPVLDFALKDSAGTTVKLSDYRGKVVLLNFWATWCAPCKIEIPWFVEFQNEYKSRNFEVLGVSMDEDGWDSVRPYMTEHKLNYPVVVGGDTIERAFGGVDDLPTSIPGGSRRPRRQEACRPDQQGHVGGRDHALLKDQVLRGSRSIPSPVLAFFSLAVKRFPYLFIHERRLAWTDRP